jgi:hypothetical protein
MVEFERYRLPSSSGLGHHPLKVAARVRIPLGVPSDTSGSVNLALVDSITL